jgi:CDP-diacylglycerol---serine O-phosphatidyltransferase
VKRHIPNLLTMANLVCGSIAVIVLSDCTVNGMGYWPALLFLAAFFDLLDGAVARALGVSGEMGKQLDSLADVVSFGLVPTLLVYRFLEDSLPVQYQWMRWISMINVCAAAYRLARFNISSSQTKDFQGMPSPAHGLFWAAIALSLTEMDWSLHFGGIVWSIVLMVLSVLTAWLMVSDLRMFSFKLKPGGFSANTIPYIYIGSLPLLAIGGLWLLPGILTTLVAGLIWYILLSMVYAMQHRTSTH